MMSFGAIFTGKMDHEYLSRAKMNCFTVRHFLVVQLQVLEGSKDKVDYLIEQQCPKFCCNYY